jgi:hypothetical protein
VSGLVTVKVRVMFCVLYVWFVGDSIVIIGGSLLGSIGYGINIPALTVKILIDKKLSKVTSRTTKLLLGLVFI